MDTINLVQKAQKGDETAYLELFRQHEERIYRMAFVYVKNQEDALDVVQETAYRSFKSIKTLKQPQYFKTWLTKIAIRCSLDLLRQRTKVIHFEPRKWDCVRTENEDDVTISIMLEDVIEKLDETEKSIILLRFYQDYTIKDAAEMLELPLGTAKTVLYRALDKLRGMCGEAEANGK
ncbi:sigma-70 family RNA polymerase sigma factor [Paenibacillus naphthalenovorans]|uniref:DNA-directed RNA polymerase sigma-70 factor n=1 Tax=Paenibacillus naphthalenovorans TaxID=162209 RepID=A0A0U2WCD3_9BACL|nr:sigma-70 family RNA polymerase sigma factor [Paenibacillus naphthalenovorans]ALS25125.1 DNA-directed RNA polymerase sigma-70 factor [Paenibacillus naphthalenovorans]